MDNPCPYNSNKKINCIYLKIKDIPELIYVSTTGKSRLPNDIKEVKAIINIYDLYGKINIDLRVTLTEGFYGGKQIDYIDKSIIFSERNILYFNELREKKNKKKQGVLLLTSIFNMLTFTDKNEKTFKNEQSIIPPHYETYEGLLKIGIYTKKDLDLFIEDKHLEALLLQSCDILSSKDSYKFP